MGSPSIMRFTLTDQVYLLSHAQSTTAGPHLPFSTCKITERSISCNCTEALRLALLFNASTPLHKGVSAPVVSMPEQIVITVASSCTDE